VITAATSLGATNATSGNITLNQTNLVAAFSATNNVGNVAFTDGQALVISGTGITANGVTLSATALTISQAIGAGAGTVSLTTTGSGVTNTLAASISATSATWTATAGSNTYNITTVKSPTALNTSGAGNTFNVSSSAPASTGNLAAITSPLSINVGTGSGNQLVVGDAGDTSSSTATITNGSITGFAPAAINYSATTGNFTHGATNDGILLIGSTTAAKTFVVQSTLAGSTTKISGGQSVTIDVGATPVANNGQLDALTGLLTVTGGGGANSLYFNDHGASAAGRYTVTATLVSKAAPSLFAGVVYDGTIGSLAIDGTDQPDQFTVAPSASTTFAFNGLLPGASPSGTQNVISLVTGGLAGINFTSSGLGRGTWTFGSGQKPVQFQNFGYFSPGMPIAAVSTAADGKVNVFDITTGALKFQLTPFSDFRRVQVITGDVTGDGNPDVIVAPDGGITPTVKIYDGVTGALLNSFNAFPANYGGIGVRLAVADVNGDGHNDLIVGAGPRSLPQVRVLNGTTLLSASPAQIGPTINALDAGFRSGVTVAAADLMNSGKAQVIVGAGMGLTPTVNVYDFNGSGYTLLKSFNAFANSFRGGVYVAAADLAGTGTGRQIIVSAGSGSLSTVNVYSSSNLLSAAALAQTTSFQAFDSGYAAGVRIAAFDGLGLGVVPVWASGTAKTVRLASFTSSSLPPAVVDALFSVNINLRAGAYIG
jgi:hypothetical protein